MPTGKTYSKQMGRWIDKDTQQAFDYESINQESSALLISFFRWYPDYFLDIIESDNSDYSLELPQRLILRAFARNQKTMITGPRGITKTYCIMLSDMIDGVLSPGEVIRYYAPSLKQGAELAATAFHQIEKNYPALASCWIIKSETKDLFKIITIYGSELAIGAIQGGNCSQLNAEEIGQETDPKFDFNDFESKVLPTNRLTRSVNKMPDPVHINNKIKIITNASSRLNAAYYKYHNNFLQQMISGEMGLALVIDMSWEISVITNIRSISYVEDLRRTMTIDDFLRQMSGTYTGSSDNPIVTDETLSKSRKLLAMEDSHCGDPEVIYIVAHDVSYEDGAKNAKCADTVIKLTKYTQVHKRDKYRKQVVYVDSYAPPATDYHQAMKLKALWRKYCCNSAGTTYLVIDAQAYGKSVIEELMKPTNDGSLPLCCYEHMRYRELEQPHALPVIYPLKAGTRGSHDEDAEMIRYAQIEFEQGNVELLTVNIYDGIEQYKLKHNIKDNFADSRIVIPYKKTDELCQQIQNLRASTAGTTVKEERKSKAVQRDDWSALKYGLRMAQILEGKLKSANYKRKSSWEDEIAKVRSSGSIGVGGAPTTIASERNRLLGLRTGGRK